MKHILTFFFMHVSVFSFGQIVVYHEQNSKLPDTINVQGVIKDICPGYCGIYCNGGVVKIKLSKAIPNYYDTYAYLVTACLSTKVKNNTIVNVIASKLTRNDKECYYKSILNSFDSKGTPFYKLSELETDKINAVSTPTSR